MMRRCHACHKKTADRRGVCMSCRGVRAAHEALRALHDALEAMGRCRVKKPTLAPLCVNGRPPEPAPIYKTDVKTEATYIP